MPRPSKQALCHPDRRHMAHGMCNACYCKHRYSTNDRAFRTKAIARAKADYRSRPEERKAAIYAWQLKHYYNITIEDYNRMMSEQRGVCVLCGKPPTQRRFKKLHVDHDHKTGKVRGLLCRGCNGLVGWYESHKEKLEEYLK